MTAAATKPGARRYVEWRPVPQSREHAALGLVPLAEVVPWLVLEDARGVQISMRIDADTARRIEAAAGKEGRR